MNIRFSTVACLALTAGLVFGQERAPDNWKQFKSTTGFSVKYPGSWFKKGTSTDRLTILSSRGGADAIIIERGQAMITVKEEEKYTGSTPSQVIDHYTQGTDVLSRQNIRNERAGMHGCRDLEQIVSKEPAVPPEDVPRSVPYMISTEYFCNIGRREYVIVLRNFEGDEKQRIYRQVALRVAESLRR